MSWTPKYQAVFEEGLVDNLLTIITRDFQYALNYFYPTENLEDFAERALGQELKNEFPLLAIVPVRNASSPSDDEARIIQALRVNLMVGVTDDGPDTVTRKIMRYMRCLDAVIRSANKRDFFANMSTQVFGLVVEAEHVYGPIGANASIYFRPATMEVTITINER